jgi:hypothetical protein
MSPGSLTSIFNWLSILLAAVTTLKLLHNGLYRRYPCLFAYVAFLIFYVAYPQFLDQKSATYFWLWVYTLPVNLAFETLVVMELCRVAMEDHRGLATLGRWAIWAGILASVAISLASLAPRIASAASRRSANLLYLVGFSRGVNLCLACFLILMVLFVSGYPVRLRRNVVLNTTIFAVQFFCNTLAAILRTIFDMRIHPSVDTVMSGLGLISLVLWCFLLSPHGESRRNAPHFLSSTLEQRLLAHLESLNRFALGFSRQS